MDKWPYQIADHNCRITWVYNKMVPTMVGELLFAGQLSDEQIKRVLIMKAVGLVSALITKPNIKSDIY